MTTDLITTGELVELLTKATRDAIWYWNLEANTIWWNKEFTTLFGHPTQIPEGGPESWYDHIHPDDRDRVVTGIHRTIDEAGTDWWDQYRFRRADGSYSTVYDKGHVLHRDGKPVCMVGTMQDITERISLEQARRESDERLRFALESAQLGTWEFDPIHNVANWDERCERLLGWVKGDISYEASLDNIHPDDKARVDEEVKWALNQESGGGYDTKFRTIGAHDKVLRWVRFIGQTYFTESGQAYRFAGVAQNITAEVLATEKAALLEHQARLAIEVSGSGSFSINLETDEIIYSPSFARILTGQENSGLTRNIFIQGIHPDDRQIRQNAYDRVDQTGILHYEARFIWTDNSVHWVRVQGQYLFDTTGKPILFSGLALDITDQIEQSKALSDSEALFRSITTASTAALWITDASLAITYVSQKWIDLTGVPLEKHLGTGWLNSVVPEDRQQAAENFLSDFQAFRYHESQFRVQHTDGSVRWVVCTGSPQYAADGKFTGYIGAILDISDRVEAEAKLRASEERFRNIIIQAPVAMNLFVGRDLLIELPNEAMLKFWDRGNGVISKPLREALPEMEGQPFLQILDDVFTTGVEYNAQAAAADLVVDGKLGTYYFNLSYKPLHDTSGAVYAILAMAIDVSGQVLAQRAIEESELRFRTLTEAIAQMTWTNTPEGDVNFYNQRWYDYTGLDFEQTKAWGWQTVVHPDDLPNTLETYKKSLADGTIFEVENRYRRGSDGLYRWHLNRAIPMRDETGEIMLWVGTATDIHEQKQIATHLEEEVQARTEQLMSSNYDLRRSNDNLEKFAYIASHDLQEPLRKIQSFGDILKSQYASQLGEGVEHLSRMQIAASRMSLLIKDLLAFSRISTRQEMANLVPLNRVVTSVLGDLELVIQQTGAQIQVDALPTVLGDESQLEQLFQNLLSNALKFQVPGVVPHVHIYNERVSASQLQPSIRPARLVATYDCIRVVDNGIGFDEKYIDRIFQVFQRLHKRNDYAGTGIGLAICEKVAANHGGAITAVSQPEQGATFALYLPATYETA